MSRLLSALLVLLTAGIGVMWTSNGAAFGPVASKKEAAVEEMAWNHLGALRIRAGSAPIQIDPVLKLWLRDKIELENIPAMPALLADLQHEFPHYLKIACVTSFALTKASLLSNFYQWKEAMDTKMTHSAIAFRPGKLGIGWHACMVVGQRLPDFSPEALSDFHQSAFYSQCNLCGHGQSCEIPRHTRSLSLQCPNCNRIYAILAGDTQGRFRYMNEFLTGYQPPAHYRSNQSRLGELMTIWQAVARQCRYTRDTGTDDNDAWQTALETQTMGTGDCEDTSILLADWLLARGFQARVALGRYAERGGHAWVVVRLDNRDYLLESTEGASHATAPPLLSSMGARYIPDMQFDRESFYTRQPDQPWHGDYWTDANWLRVAPRALQTPPAATSASVSP